MNTEEYKALVDKKAPKSNILRDCLKAFWVGGLICLAGEVISSLLKACPSLDETSVSAWTSVILVFFGVLLTGLGIYDKIGGYAGAGGLVPITGFANSIASPAMEFKAEGFVTGLGVKMFIIAGPVIVYGLCASWIVGLIYMAVRMFL